MRVLYAIQGFGNGHLARAAELVPHLRGKVAQLDVLVSGPTDILSLPFAVQYRCAGLSFVPDLAGGISYLDTFR